MVGAGLDGGLDEGQAGGQAGSRGAGRGAGSVRRGGKAGGACPSPGRWTLSSELRRAGFLCEKQGAQCWSRNLLTPDGMGKCTPQLLGIERLLQA